MQEYSEQQTEELHKRIEELEKDYSLSMQALKNKVKEVEKLKYELDNANDKIINYIEKDSEIAMPINELMREDGTHLTKKEYGLVVLKYLVIELKERFKKNNQNK